MAKRISTPQAIIKPEDLEREMTDLVNQFRQINFEITQEALEEVSQELAQILASATHTAGTGQMKSSWRVKPYKNVKYVHNVRGTKGIDQGIPLTNLAEYSRRGPQPFIKKTWERHRQTITRRFVQLMEQKLKEIK